MARTSRLVSTAIALTTALLASGLHPAAATGEAAGNPPVSTRLPISLPGWDHRLTDVIAAPDGTTYILSDRFLTRARAGGRIDSGFGVSGNLALPVLTSAEAMAWHGDELLIAGTAFTGTGGGPTNGADESAVIRIDVSGSGSLDTTFGVNGVRMIGLPDTDVSATDIGVAPDGDVVVVGYRTTPATFADETESSLTLVRLDEDGDLDPTFDSDGIAVTDLVAFPDELIVGADGYIVSLFPNTITRFTTSGVVDTSFGAAGTYTSASTVSSIAPMTDDRVAVSTGYSRYEIRDSTVGVTVLDRSGAPVHSFGDRGTRTFDIGGSFFAGRVTVRADGRLLLTTAVSEAVTDVLHTVGLLADGTIDRSVGRNGWASTTEWNNGFSAAQINGAVMNESRGTLRVVGGYSDDQEWIPKALDIALRQPGAPASMPGRVVDAALRGSGKAVVLREWVDDSSAFRSFMVQKVRTSGRLDTTFAADGTYRFASPRGMSWPDAIAVQATSVIVGYRDHGAGSRTTHLLRLDADGAVDRTFGRNGRITVPSATSLQLRDVLVDGGGRIVTLSVEVEPNGHPRVVLHRFTPNGAVDTRFGTNGRRVVPASLGVRTEAEVVQHGRGYIFATYSADVRPVPRIVRVTSAGRLDSGFVTNLPPSGRTPNERATVGHFAAEPSNDPDGGRIALIVGTSRPSLWMLRPNGSPLTTFGEGGRIRVGPNTREPDGLIEFRAGGRVAVYEAEWSGKQLAVNGTTYLRSGARDPDRPPFTKQTAASAQAIDLLRASPSEPITAVIGCNRGACTPTVRIATD
jgi:uncharacterized delta-60 repeat protein